MAMKKVKLTEKVVVALKADTKDVLLWDAQLRGFGIRVKRSGIRSFFVHYKVGKGFGRKKRVTIGQWPVFSVEAARKEAMRRKAMAADNKDPDAELTVAENQAVTVEQLGKRYVEEHCKPRLGPGSVANVEGPLRATHQPAHREEARGRADPHRYRRPASGHA